MLVGTIKKIDWVIDFGHRMNDKKNELGVVDWSAFKAQNFPKSGDELPPFLYIAANETQARKIFKTQPKLSINGLYKTLLQVNNETSRI